MTHKLGLHWLRYHPDQHDFAHIERMQYPSIKPFQWMWNNADFCRDLLAVLPGDSYILARDHPLSEQKAEMWHDPVGTGQRHANEWAEKVRSRQYHLPTDRTFFLGINEPDATNGDRSAIDRYNVALLDRLKQHGLRGGAFNFSTGHPRTVDGTPNTPADYSVFESTHAAIVRGHHIAVAHIYGTTAVPLAPGHYDRLTACNWTDVQWVIGEFGIDEHVVGGGPHVGFHGGLEGRLEEYCRWLDFAIMGIEAVFPYIHSYETFTYDFSHPWDTFDVQVIREALESYQWEHAKQGNGAGPDDKPVDIYLPFVGKENQPTAGLNGYVATPAGANLRSAPFVSDETLIMALPYGERIEVLSIVEGLWAHVRWQSVTGYIRSDLLTVELPPREPVPMPEPQPAGIIEPATALAFLQVESGNRSFEGGLLVIRFEVHRFKANLKNDELFNRHFKFTPGNYGEQYWRPDEGSAWRHAHGNQHERHELLKFARNINNTAALRSTGMGLGQVMGENHARIGYATPQAMFNAFSHPRYGVNAQVHGFMSYIYSDPALLDALRRGDWHRAVQGYNGTGQEHIYVPALEEARTEITKEIGA